MAGNADAGKSTTIGVLTSGILDNGNGSARTTVAKHKHETKHTSDISERLIVDKKTKRGITLIDLCGQDTYLKTTTFGLTGHHPDYGLLVVSVNNGIQPMTKEHFALLVYLDIPIMIVLTRVDITHNSQGTYQTIQNNIQKLCKMAKKQCKFINTYDYKNPDKEEQINIDEISKMLYESNNTIPIITISNKTGYGIDKLRSLLLTLKPRPLWEETKKESLFYIDSIFKTDVGTVVSGTSRGETIKVGSTLYLGPKNKQFYPVRVKSIHNNNRELIPELKDHWRGCIALASLDKKVEITKDFIGKGMILLSGENQINNVCFRFKAEIEILRHSTTIGSNYSPMIHCGAIRQTARLIINKDDNDGKEVFKMGEKGIVTFKFKYKSEYLEVGETFFFREGTTRGVGTIKELIPIAIDEDAYPDEINNKKKYIIKKPFKNKETYNPKLIKVK